MIQFNLLPDIKQEFVKVNRLKRTVITLSVLVSAALLVIFVLLLSWDGLQKKNLSDINHDISTNETKLTNTPNLNQILTIQNQLNSLPALEKQDPTTSRLFGYLSEITPTAATLSGVTVDFGQHTVQASGNADSLATVNVFADTLKFTTYEPAGSAQTYCTTTDQTSCTQPPLAFSDVVLASFSVNQSGGIGYTLNFNFAPALFNSGSSPTLSVPQEVTTRSELDQPVLFKQSTNASNGS